MKPSCNEEEMETWLGQVPGSGDDVHGDRPQRGRGTWKEVSMIRRNSRSILLQGAIALAVLLGTATQLATPAAADSDDWWRHHRYGHQHDNGGIYFYSGPRYYYAPPPAYYYPPPAYYYAPPYYGPSFSFGFRVH
jgi:hypothetical protein